MFTIMVKIMLLVALIAAAVAVISSLLFGKKSENPANESFIYWLKTPIKPRWVSFINRSCWLITLVAVLVAACARLIHVDANMWLGVPASLAVTGVWFLVVQFMAWVLYAICWLIKEARPIGQGFVKWYKSEEDDEEE